jgi:peptidoglycan hydrolase-like amidase
MIKRKTYKKSFILFIASILIFSPLATLAQIESSPAIPEIISRSEWGADESKMTWKVEYADVKKFVIHHTASSNLVEDTDGSGEYKSMVNNIYNYHAGKKTWTDNDGETLTGFGDIGYNYLIDPNGNIYEGRDGGNEVIGGHTTGFNTGSVGISVIGNYQENNSGTNATINSKITKALEKLVGWLAANNSININKTSSFNSKTVDGVIGHKDLAATLCPGNILYEKLNTIQENAYLYSQAYQNYAYQLKGSNAVYILENGKKIKFNSEADLPSSYASRTIKVIDQNQLNAYQFQDLATYPDGSLLRETNQDVVYYIQDGAKRPLEVTWEEFLKFGFQKADIISVSKSELNLYEDGDKIKFAPEGTLIKDEKNNIYFIEQGKKRLFTSAKLFEYLKYDWKKVKADENAKYYLEGSIMTYPNETVIKAKDNPSVYLMVDGKRRAFPSATMFERLGYKWKNILEIENTEINRYTVLGNVVYPDGTLIRAEGEQTVYLVDKGQKRAITSETLLKKLGYSFSNVITIPKNTIGDYQTGEAASYPDGTLIKIKNNPAVYQVSNGTKKEFTSMELFKAVGGNWSNVIEISNGEMDLYETNGSVRYPENSLIKKSGGEKIYVIKNGQAVWIKTAEEFLKAGYKWSNVIQISALEMDLYAKETTAPDANNTNNGTNNNTTTDNTQEPVSVISTEPKIRVAITYSEGSDITITANGNYTVEYYDADKKVYQTIKKGNGEKTVVPYFTWSKYIKFIPESENVILQVLSYKDPSWNGATDDNRFRGNLELKYSSTSKKLWVIDELDLEDYLNGIAEATTYTETEYLKAFSTIARTYAMYYIEKGGKHTGEDFHLKNSRNGNGNDQVYRGYDLEMRAAQITSANKATKGQIIKFNGKTIVAAYSSDSGGITKSGCDVLSKNYCTSDFDYLDGGVKDPANTKHDQAKISASHGAGMSAVGASQMASEGSGWQEIIKYYYPGVNMNKVY